MRRTDGLSAAGSAAGPPVKHGETVPDQTADGN